MENEAKKENGALPEETLDAVAGGAPRTIHHIGSKVQCKRCENLRWPSELISGYCSSCFDEMEKQGFKILL